MGKGKEVDRKDGNYTSSTVSTESDSGLRPAMIPVPDSPWLSAELLSPHAPSDGYPHLEPSFHKTCAPPQARRAAGTQYDEMTWGQLRDQCSQRGFRKKESGAVLKTRLTEMDAAEAKRNLKEVTEEAGKRGRTPVRGVKVSDIPPSALGPHAMDRISERAPVQGVKGSDNPTELMDLAGTRERAPAKG